MTALKKTVDEYNSASTQAMMNGSTDAIMPYYTEDAMSFSPNKPAVKGRAAIKTEMDNMMKSGMKVTSAVFMTTELNAAGKMAHEIGTYTMGVDVPGMGSMKDAGKYVVIWTEQPDKSWKIHAEIWNSDMPVPSMNAPKMDSKKGKMDAKKGKPSTKAMKAPAKKMSKPSGKASSKSAPKKTTKKK